MKLPTPQDSSLVGKVSERFAEVVNIAATMERLLDTLQWFQENPQYGALVVGECHPSTSDDADGNDIVLRSLEGAVRVRCEVCDVVSSCPGQNGKEKSDLKNLGCEAAVPEDGVDRYIATSPEFAEALASSARKWKDKPYRYEVILTAGDESTHLLQIRPPLPPPSAQ